MATKRTITSDIWEDDFFGELDFMWQALWIGLFSRCADDQGRIYDSPKAIKSHVFPYKDVLPEEVDEALTYFANEEKILRYEVDGKHYIQLVHWWEHQTPQWAMFSKYPPPPGWVDRVRATYKGEYIAINWPSKQSTLPAQVDYPGGQSSQPPEVARHNLNLNHVNDPNLNQHTMILEDIAADAAPPPAEPPIETPPPDPPEQPKNGASPALTDGQRRFLDAFGAKRFKTPGMREAVLALERKHGTTKLREGIAWASKKGMTIGDAITALETALPDWGRNKGTTKREREDRDDPLRQSDAARARYSKWKTLGGRNDDDSDEDDSP